MVSKRTRGGNITRIQEDGLDDVLEKGTFRLDRMGHLEY